MAPPLLYSSLASLWPIFSPPEDYVEEVATFRKRLLRMGVPDGGSLLHLGSGGGSVDYNLKRFQRVVGVDLSADMIRVAQRVNPEVEYVHGDMREVRLGRTFDAVLVHDAISYMTSVADLEKVYRTAAEHLLPGGVMLALPEELRERVAVMGPTAERHSSTDIQVDVLETQFDPDPTDHSYEGIYVFVINDRGNIRVEVDRHQVGVFELNEFLGAIERAGFTAEAEPWELSEWGDAPPMPLITAVRR